MQEPGEKFKFELKEDDFVSASGTVIEERYEILDELGKGGMGVVYKAWHRLLERHVAVKMLHQHIAADEKQLLAMRAEARIIAELQHPNIVQVHAFGTTEEGAPYVVMELLDGEPLSEILREQDKLSIERCLDLTLQMAHALEFAHGKGIVHRDLKPSNVVITRGPDGGEQVKIVDFGIARRFEQSSTLTQVVGSPMYMSPGQFLGRRGSVRSDLYSLGCVIHETACGAPPFVGETPIETMRKQISEPPPALRSLRTDTPMALQNIVLKLLAKDPEQRYQSATELIKDLTALKNALSGQGAEPDVKVPELKTNSDVPLKKVPWRAVMLAAAGVLAVLAAVMFFNAGSERDDFDPDALMRQSRGKADARGLNLPTAPYQRFQAAMKRLKLEEPDKESILVPIMQQALVAMSKDKSLSDGIMADSYLEAGRYFSRHNEIRRWAENAEMACKHASRIKVRNSAKYVEALAELARACTTAGDGMLALKCLDVAENSLPKAPRSANQPGYRGYTMIVPVRMEAYWRLGEMEKALQQAEIASDFEISGSSHEGYYKSAVLQALNKTKRYKETIKHFNDLWEVTNWSPVHTKTLAANEAAIAFMEMGQTDEAKKVLRPFLGLTIDKHDLQQAFESQRSRLLLARVLHKEKKFGEEIALLKEALTIEAQRRIGTDMRVDLLRQFRRACEDSGQMWRFKKCDPVLKKLTEAQSHVEILNVAVPMPPGSTSSSR